MHFSHISKNLSKLENISSVVAQIPSLKILSMNFENIKMEYKSIEILKEMCLENYIGLTEFRLNPESSKFMG